MKFLTYWVPLTPNPMALEGVSTFEAGAAALALQDRKRKRGHLAPLVCTPTIGWVLTHAFTAFRINPQKAASRISPFAMPSANQAAGPGTRMSVCNSSAVNSRLIEIQGRRSASPSP